MFFVPVYMYNQQKLKTKPNKDLNINVNTDWEAAGKKTILFSHPLFLDQKSNFTGNGNHLEKFQVKTAAYMKISVCLK